MDDENTLAQQPQTSAPQEERVNVVDPDTYRVGSIPRSKLERAVQLGYRPATDEEATKQIDETKYSSPLEIAKTFGEGLIGGATLNLSKIAERAAGAELKGIQKRPEINPGTYGLGQVLGFGLSTLAGGTEAALLAKSEQLALKGLGLAAEEGVKLGAAKAIGSAAVKGAVAGFLMSSGDEVAKAVIEDPHKTAQAAAVDAGLNILASTVGGGVVGGGFGAIGEGLGSVKGLWKAKFGNSAEKALQEVANKVDFEAARSGLSFEEAEAANLAAGQAAEQAGAGYNQLAPGYFETPESMVEKSKAGLIDRFIQPVENVQDVAEAFTRQGIKDLPPEVLSADKMARDLGYDLTQEGTVSGNKRAKLYQRMWDKLSDNLEGLFRNRTDMTPYEAGTQLREGFVNSLSKEYEPLQAGYSALKDDLRKMAVPQAAKEEALAKLVSPETLNVAPESDAAKLVGRVTKEIGNLQNAEQINKYRTLINAELGDALSPVAGNRQKAEVLFAVKNALNDLREAAINGAEKSIGLGEGVESVGADKLAKLKELDKGYAEFKKRIGELGRQTGLGKNIGSTRQLLDKIKGLPTEDIAKRFFDTTDLDQLNFLKQNFPEQFELARRASLKQIFEASKSTAQGGQNKFMPNKFLDQIKDKRVTKEALNILFPGGGQTIEDAKTIFYHMPENPNPAGSGYVIARQAIGNTGQWIAQNISGFAKSALLDSIPKLQEAFGAATPEERKAIAIATGKFLSSGSTPSATAFKSMVDVIAATIRGENAMGKGVKYLFDSGAKVLPKMIIDQSDLLKLDKKVDHIQENPQSLMDDSASTAYYMPDHAVALSETTASAISYLASIKPRVQKQSPLDDEPELNQIQKQQWHSALAIAQSPLSILPKVKDGLVTPQEVMHLQRLYPAAYQSLTQKMRTALMDHVAQGKKVPYKTRLGMSIFLAEPLDSTMMPQSIVAAQTKGAVAAEKAKQDMQTGVPQQRQKHSMAKLDKLAPSYMTPQQARISARSQA